MAQGEDYIVTLPAFDMPGSFFYVSSANRGAACTAGKLRLHVTVLPASPVDKTFGTPVTMATPLKDQVEVQRRVVEDDLSGSGSGVDPVDTTAKTTVKTTTKTTTAADTSPEAESFSTTLFLAGDFDTIKNLNKFAQDIRDQLFTVYQIPRDQITDVSVVRLVAPRPP